MNVTTEEEHTNEPYDMIGNDNPPNQGLHPNFDVFDDFFEDSNEDVAKFAAEAGDVPQTSRQTLSYLYLNQQESHNPFDEAKESDSYSCAKTGPFPWSRETPKETDASVWRRYREQCKRSTETIGRTKGDSTIGSRLETSTKRGTVNAGGERSTVSGRLSFETFPVKRGDPQRTPADLLTRLTCTLPPFQS